MQQAFDDRLFTLGIELENGIETFSDLYISAKGVQFAGNINNECEVLVYNLTASQRNYLLTQTSPFAVPRTPKIMTIDVGRKSTGTFRLYQGEIFASNPTQPPDIGVTLMGLTGFYGLGNTQIINQPALSKLSTIAAQVAQNNNATLNFLATDKNISNFSSDRVAYKQIEELSDCGGIYVSLHNGVLTVIDQNATPPNSAPRLVNKSTGMVGIPQIDELGVVVKVMLDSTFQLFGMIQIESDLNPAANGIYQINRLEFEVATRDEPWWYTVHAKRYFIPLYKTLP